MALQKNECQKCGGHNVLIGRAKGNSMHLLADMTYLRPMGVSHVSVTGRGCEGGLARVRFSSTLSHPMRFFGTASMVSGTVSGYA